MQSPTFLEIGREQYENYKSRVTKKIYIQYDYRHLDGELFSCIANNLEEAREKRNEWVSKRRIK